MKIKKILKVNELRYTIKDLTTLDYYVFITENENSFTSNYFIYKSEVLRNYMSKLQGEKMFTLAPGPSCVAKWEKDRIKFYDYSGIEVAYFIITDEFLKMLDKGVEEIKNYNGPLEF